ncbi:pirin family protein [Nitrosomonas sp. Is35]|uniref:pirin family protein n=1 Tax=Nitrosomonas sp. Is35 TaxID=3080534 RepID=UPI00294B5001|nr:pirin family protein [Nitrosomonas sp. Is35]MDV6348852.1 pirin family protein [Nitrosomonas sp. Is35]
MPIQNILEGQVKDLGGFSVRRILPNAKQRMVGPWIFFDHMGPAEFKSGEGINVRPHPHINLATVTYLFEGEILHRDSLGNHQLIRPGEINLMVAGSGITHSERESDETRNTVHKQHGLQLWHVLPEKDEETAPAFYHYAYTDLPAVTVDEVVVRVLMGDAYGVTSPVISFSEILYIEAQLQSGQILTLPQTAEAALYVVEGKVSIQDNELQQYQMMTMDNAGELTVTATQESRIVVIGGEPLGERHIYWNFASSRKERIQKAKQDWREGRFAKVKGDKIEFIPLPSND